MWKSSIVFVRVRGIEIGANWTWFFVFALIVLSLATSAFPAIRPGQASWVYALMALVAAGLLFTSLVLHELGHAFQALREGMRIEGITLWIFGGVAKFSGMFPSAGAEFRVAIAGPLVTLVIALVGGALTAIPGLPEPVLGVIEWLASVNLLLLVFNMLPAFPMDGGRVLRSAIWQRKRDFARATEIAGGVGRAFGQFFIAGGLALALLARMPGGIWFALIGWFVIAAGQAEVQMARMRTAFAGMTVADLMVHEPVSVPQAMSVDEFERAVLPGGAFRAYPVIGPAGEAIGLLRSERATALPRAQWPSTPVTACMVPLEQALCVPAERDLGETVLELMQTEPGRALVAEHGHLRGLLSITDVTRWLELLGGRGGR
jgi:Zn-dependent protease